MYTIVFVDFFKNTSIYRGMSNECKKCSVVHSSLAEKCFSCGGSLKTLKTTLSTFGFPTLVATTFLSLSIVMLNIDLFIGG